LQERNSYHKSNIHKSVHHKKEDFSFRSSDNIHQLICSKETNNESFYCLKESSTAKRLEIIKNKTKSLLEIYQKKIDFIKLDSKDWFICFIHKKKFN